jgi:quinol monooxygenase YgiN
MVLLTARMKVPREKRKELLQTLCALMGRTRRHEGCIRCDCYQHVEQGEDLCVIMEWKNRKAIDRYVRSDDLAVLLGAVHALTKSGELSYFVVSAQRSLEPSFPIPPIQRTKGTTQKRKCARPTTVKKKKRA